MSAASGRSRLLGSGALRFTAQPAWFDAERRLAASAASGVDAEVVSPFPPLLNYRLPAAYGRDLARWVNEYIASLCRAAPGRIYGLGTVPLQDPDLAAGLLAEVAEIGLAGVEIASNIGGLSLADERFLGFFAEAERLGTAIFVHAMPVASDRLPPPATATFGVGVEGSLAAAALITGGVAEKHPGLRLAFSHGAGGFPLMLPQGPVVLGPDLERGTARRARAGGRTVGRRDRADGAGATVLLRLAGLRPPGHPVPHRHDRPGPAAGGVGFPGHAAGGAGRADASVHGAGGHRAGRHHLAQLLPVPGH